MTEIIGDTVMPSDLIVPERLDDSRTTISGSLFISGIYLVAVDNTGTARYLSGVAAV